MKRNFKLLVAGICWILANPLLAGPVEDLQMYKSRYPEDHRVYMNRNKSLDISVKGDSLNILVTHSEDVFCLTSKAIQSSDVSIEYSSFSPVEKIKACTYVPDGNKYRKLEVTDFKTTKVLQEDVFLDDAKSVSFFYPGVVIGAKTHLEYTSRMVDPHFLPAFYFNSFMQVEQAQFSITCPESVNIGYKLMNCDSIKIDFQKVADHGKISYSWKVSNLKHLKYEENSPSMEYYAPHIIVYIKDYTINGKKTSVLSDINDMHKWYNSHVSNLDDPSKEIALKQTVDSLTKGLHSDPEKVKAIYYWVKDHIKYIAIEFGYGGFIPRSAWLVYTRRYGDCKDMAHLLVRMLQLAGITSYHTWIGSRHLPYKYSDIALPQVDNHMICTYKDAGKYYYLDATDPYLKFGYATSFIQGKEAFINIDASKYEIATVPDVDTNMNTVYDTVWLRLEGSKIVGKGIAHFTGYQKALYTNIFMDETYKEITQSLNTYFQKGSNKFLVDTFRLYHLMSKDSDLIVTYDFNIEDYAKSSDDEIFINLHLDKTLLKATIEKNRQHDMFRPEKVKIVYKIYLEIPTGYRIEYMPDNTSFYDPQFGFRIGYKQDKLVVDKTETIILNTLLLKQADFKTWNNMVSKIRESYNKTIILKKK